MGMTPEQDAAFSRALSLRDAGRFHSAAEILVFLTNELPDNAGVWGMLGSILYEVERFDDAREAFAHAVNLSPRSELASLGLFFSLLRSGHEEEAWSERRRFTALVPESKEYQLLDSELRAGGFDPVDGQRFH